MLYFEVLRKKTHVLCEVHQNSPVSELKKIVAGVLKIPPEFQILKKPVERKMGRGTFMEWTTLYDWHLVKDMGFSEENANVFKPAVLALILPEDKNRVFINPLSAPDPNKVLPSDEF
ncbi:elongin-B [Ditylenchus destructor]|uniref:Elongin-B n=1 Tax=Ditylenchus destructor TaxID=166010 RepID=A0AAD4MZ28_9BILA|nr:elongin-B [Ditylenchus destructor]